MIRLGGHGLEGGAEDPAAFARAHRDVGYTAAYCPPVELSDSARLRTIEAAFAADDVTLAEVGIWRNLLAVEPERRAVHLDHARTCLAIADETGTVCAVSYIGSFAPETDYAPHPENLGPRAFEATVETVRGIIDAVAPKRAKFALEMMQYALPDSIDSYLDLIAAIDRPAFAVHLDPVNLIMTPRRYYASGAFVQECFERLGAHIVSCHLKDITLHHKAALHLDEVMVGDGDFDVAAFLRAAAAMPRDIPVLLEHLEQDQYATARERVRAIARAEDIALR